MPLTQKLVGLPASDLTKLKRLSKWTKLTTSELIRIAVLRYLVDMRGEFEAMKIAKMKGPTE